MKLQTLLPIPSDAQYQHNASKAAGFSLTTVLLVSSSIRAAPTSISLTSIPCNAAGSKPTADNSDVLPPTQSNIGNRANHPSILAVLSNREFS
uniref:Uncharacterized protein n=1 Tax=Arundo donax TaxID=35708 RepID=A0A0A9DKY9_ARUDO